MNKIATKIMVGALLIASLTQAQIIVNEVSPNAFLDLVEIKNDGNSAVDIGTYYICSFPAYEQISDLTAQCGDFQLDPGELVVITGHDLGDTHGEVGIYTTNDFGNPDAMSSYMEYGEAGHAREDEAVSAGLWTVGSFAAAVNFNGGHSLAYDGDGITGADWLDAFPPSPCLDNSVGVEEVISVRGVKVFPNPAAEKICIESEILGEIKVIDSKGSVVLRMNKTAPLLIIDLEGIESGLYVLNISEQSVRFRKE